MDAHVKTLKTWCRRETQKAINKGILVRDPYVPDAARWNKEEKERHEFRKLLDRKLAKLQRQNARLLSAARRSR